MYSDQHLHHQQQSSITSPYDFVPPPSIMNAAVAANPQPYAASSTCAPTQQQQQPMARSHHQNIGQFLQHSFSTTSQQNQQQPGSFHHHQQVSGGGGSALVADHPGTNNNRLAMMQQQRASSLRPTVAAVHQQSLTPPLPTQQQPMYQQQHQLPPSRQVLASSSSPIGHHRPPRQSSSSGDLAMMQQQNGCGGLSNVPPIQGGGNGCYPISSNSNLGSLPSSNHVGPMLGSGGEPSQQQSYAPNPSQCGGNRRQRVAGGSSSPRPPPSVAPRPLGGSYVGGTSSQPMAMPPNNQSSSQSLAMRQLPGQQLSNGTLFDQQQQQQQSGGGLDQLQQPAVGKNAMLDQPYYSQRVITPSSSMIQQQPSNGGLPTTPFMQHQSQQFTSNGLAPQSTGGPAFLPTGQQPNHHPQLQQIQPQLGGGNGPDFDLPQPNNHQQLHIIQQQHQQANFGSTPYRGGGGPPHQQQIVSMATMSGSMKSASSSIPTNIGLHGGGLCNNDPSPMMTMTSSSPSLFVNGQMSTNTVLPSQHPSMILQPPQQMPNNIVLNNNNLGGGKANVKSNNVTASASAGPPTKSKRSRATKATGGRGNRANTGANKRSNANANNNSNAPVNGQMIVPPPSSMMVMMPSNSSGVIPSCNGMPLSRGSADYYPPPPNQHHQQHTINHTGAGTAYYNPSIVVDPSPYALPPRLPIGQQQRFLGRSAAVVRTMPPQQQPWQQASLTPPPEADPRLLAAGGSSYQLNGTSNDASRPQQMNHLNHHQQQSHPSLSSRALVTNSNNGQRPKLVTHHHHSNSSTNSTNKTPATDPSSSRSSSTHLTSPPPVSCGLPGAAVDFDRLYFPITNGILWGPMSIDLATTPSQTNNPPPIYDLLPHGLSIRRYEFDLSPSHLTTITNRNDLDVVLWPMSSSRRRQHRSSQPINFGLAWPDYLRLRFNGHDLNVAGDRRTSSNVACLKALCRPGRNLLELILVDLGEDPRQPEVMQRRQEIATDLVDIEFICFMAHTPTLAVLMDGLSRPRAMSDSSPHYRSLADHLFDPPLQTPGNQQQGDIVVVSLTCQLTGRRLQLPGRVQGCSRHDHLFDLEPFLASREVIWPHLACPICGLRGSGGLDSLYLDQTLAHLLTLIPPHADKLLIRLSDGHWSIDPHKQWLPLIGPFPPPPLPQQPAVVKSSPLVRAMLTTTTPGGRKRSAPVAGPPDTAVKQPHMTATTTPTQQQRPSSLPPVGVGNGLSTCSTTIESPSGTSLSNHPPPPSSSCSLQHPLSEPSLPSIGQPASATAPCSSSSLNKGLSFLLTEPEEPARCRPRLTSTNGGGSSASSTPATGESQPSLVVKPEETAVGQKAETFIMETDTQQPAAIVTTATSSSQASSSSSSSSSSSASTSVGSNQSSGSTRYADLLASERLCSETIDSLALQATSMADFLDDAYIRCVVEEFAA